MWDWTEVRAAAGRVGCAVARRCYPTARSVKNPREHPADLLFPSAAGWIEAKACATRGRVVLSDPQLDLFMHRAAEIASGRLVISVYCLRGAKALPAPIVDVAVARNVRIVLDIAAPLLTDMFGAEGWAQAGSVVRWALSRPDAMKYVLFQAHLRLPHGQRAMLTLVPVIRVGVEGCEVAKRFSLGATREREGGGLPF